MDTNYFVFLIGYAGWVLYFQYTLQDGQILEKYKDYISFLPSYLGKPLGLCIYCNMFWWCLVFYFSGAYTSLFSFIGFIYIFIYLWKNYIKT